MAEPEKVENTETSFDEDSDLGVEFVKIYLKEQGKGMKVQVIHKQGIEKILPQNFIDYVMNNIGNFMIHAISELQKATEAAAIQKAQAETAQKLEDAVNNQKK